MPELPEVETIRHGLNELIAGKKITAVSFDWPKSFPNDSTLTDAFMIGASIRQVRRRAKVLIIDFDNEYSVITHLKMTGQLVYRSPDVNFGAGHPSASLIGNLPDKSTRVVIDFSDGSKLFFNDQRKFGWMRLLPTVEIKNIDFFKKVGPEPLEPGFTWLELRKQLMRRKNLKIKAALLDQTVVAGIGNIYADESLWGAKIHPERIVNSLSAREIHKLYDEILFVLRLSIEKGGSTDKNYVNHEGKKGSYLEFARVFRREHMPCPRCQTEIVKIRVAGRGTHICPSCQKLRSNKTV
ncbi:MAG TPA: bifunctional DNA-formamidopyrimidine glycosylase/DNA-(apurinic or apyrimidinic site) lyase [Candidatus Saccharimonadales bacterium]|nr:bifunctional DNA-formamidopyrimidine glycosylase/DNA-(apurinic or apyrimidinic site) lyase [Candidatus Saccharimonadales bacterium]